MLLSNQYAILLLTKLRLADEFEVSTTDLNGSLRGTIMDEVMVEFDVFVFTSKGCPVWLASRLSSILEFSVLILMNDD